jgi:ElaB/YqjD/DUF883 family membrane-anchored ribosome-binding protein
MENSFERSSNAARGALQAGMNSARDSATQVGPHAEKLVESFRALIADGEEVMNSLVGASNEGVSLARERFSEKLATAKQAYQEAENSLRSKVSDATQSADQYVADNPWRAVAIAASAGAVVAFLMQRASR